eukprot:NODE_52_length_30984_cov_1.383358.p23 type:complete len:196 gc:universal NODE_52_length_30984_cov_1.383358:29527-28940(-)
MVADRYKYEFVDYFTRFHNVNDLFDRHCHLLYSRKQYADLFETIQLAGENAKSYVLQHKDYLKLPMDLETFKILHVNFKWPIDYESGQLRRNSSSNLNLSTDIELNSAPQSRKSSLVKEKNDKRTMRLLSIAKLASTSSEFTELYVMILSMLQDIPSLKNTINTEIRDKWEQLMFAMESSCYLSLRDLVLQNVEH